MLLSTSFCHLFVLACNALFLVSFHTFDKCESFSAFYREKISLLHVTFLQGLRSDRFKTIKLYKMRVSSETDFAKYPVIVNLLRHKGKHFRYQMICMCL